MIAFLRLRSSLASLPLLAALAACGPAAVTETPSVEVAVTPANAQVAPGGTVSFSALVTGSTDTSVEWLVASPSSGTVSTSGVYTAPTVAGTYEVTAKSKAKGNAWGKATVTVTPTPTPTPTPIAIGISPVAASVVAGGQVTFAAAVSGTTNTAVTWSVVEAGCGTITAAGVYTAPGAAGTCHVAAASVADPSKTSQAAVTVTAAPAPPPVISVSVAPANAAVDACRTVALAASVTGTSNGAVTWSVAEGAAGGTITSAGVYTAPTLAGTYHAVATSQADPTRTSTATIVVAQRVLSVAVNPGTVSVPPGGTAQFTATVTTTCGTTVATQTVTAPTALSVN